MSTILSSIEAEFRRYKALAEASFAQLSDDELIQPGPGEGNSVTIIAWHVAGNLASRFTDFLTDDGEKPWRDREDEFRPRNPTRSELILHWERGWRAVFDTLSTMTDDQLRTTVRIRGLEHPVHQALHRLLAHASYHVGQIVYLAKAIRGKDWKYLTIPPGMSEDYNRNPTHERGSAHAALLDDLDKM